MDTLHLLLSASMDEGRSASQTCCDALLVWSLEFLVKQETELELSVESHLNSIAAGHSACKND